MSQKNKYVLAVDIGGTKIATSLVSFEGKVYCKRVIKTKPEGGREGIIEKINGAIEKTMLDGKKKHITPMAIGIGCGGPLDSKKGIIHSPPNIKSLRNVPLRKIVQEKFKLPAFLENDANAAALAEHMFGAGKGTNDMIYITWSTGIGGGIILGGKLHQGKDNCAGEVGHQVVLVGGHLCGCGKRGCLEAEASGSAIANIGRETIKEMEKTNKKKTDKRKIILNKIKIEKLTVLSKIKLENLTARDIIDAAREGDRISIEIVNRAADFFGVGLANIIHILNLQMIVVGGGISKAGDFVFRPAIKAFKRETKGWPQSDVEIRTSLLGDNIGDIGAAAAAIVGLRK
ncbi:MAG: ROK family protein [Thermoplasmata archaeon]